VVAFDLDGTIIQGLEYSWKLIWRILGYDDEERREGMQRYLKRHSRADGLSYRDWCDWCCKKFQLRGLCRFHLEAIASELKLTHNFYPTIHALKSSGCILAIISGGVDTLLYEMIPDADQLFDYVFINRLVFDKGELLRIEPTEGDFEGKRSVLERICGEANFTLHDAVFVGDSLNDEHIVSTDEIGLRIAYNAHSQRVKELSDVVISDNDFSLILPHILEM